MRDARGQSGRDKVVRLAGRDGKTDSGGKMGAPAVNRCRRLSRVVEWRLRSSAEAIVLRAWRLAKVEYYIIMVLTVIVLECGAQVHRYL